MQLLGEWKLDDGGVDLRAWQGLALMYPGFGPLIEGIKRT